MNMFNIYVRISQDEKTTGGFVNQATRCWTVDLVNSDTNEVKKLCSGMNEWSTFYDKNKAEEVAKEWADFLGCDIRRFKIQRRTTYEYVEE